jgi:hypothetical protein
MTTYPRHAERWNQHLYSTPEPLTTLAVRQPKPHTLLGMIDELARPLMAICMKDGDGPSNAVEELWDEIPLPTAPFQLTADIIQHPDDNVRGEGSEELLEKSDGKVLRLAWGVHICKPQGLVVSAEKGE